MSTANTLALRCCQRCTSFSTKGIIRAGRRCRAAAAHSNSHHHHWSTTSTTTTTTTTTVRSLASLSVSENGHSSSSQQQQHQQQQHWAWGKAAIAAGITSGVVFNHSISQSEGNHSKISSSTILAQSVATLGSSTSSSTSSRRIDAHHTPPGTAELSAAKERTSLREDDDDDDDDSNNNNNNNNNPEPIRRMPTQAVGVDGKPRNVMLHRLRSLAGRGLHDKYKVDWKTVLGEGAYGSVHPARLNTTGEKVALKKICRHYTNASGFKTETDALLRIYDNGGHPNISGLRDMYEDQNYYYLILDLVTGGEMFEHLINYGAYSEADAARLMQEIASALAFLHGVGIVHADLKPENLLLSTKNRLDGTIKMIDFGCAYLNYDDEYISESMLTELESGDDKETALEMIKRKVKLQNQNTKPSSTGTSAYWSPERFQQNDGPTPAMDMWSVGLILYIMLTGVHPFDVMGCSTDEEIEQHILADPRPPLDEDLVGHLSDSAVDLIVKLMEKDPAKRLTAYEMLQHPWVRGETALKEKIQDSDKKLSRFKDIRYKLEAGMFAVLVSQGYSDARLSEAKINRKNSSEKMFDDRSDGNHTHIMQRAFAAFDTEGKGFVTSHDLERVANERTGSKLSPNDTKAYLRAAREQNQQIYLPAGMIGQIIDADPDDDSSQFLSLSQFNKLFSGLHHKHFPRGHYIFHAGDKGDAMYFLSSGKVEIQTRKGQLVSILRSGDFFGEGSLLDPKNTRFTAAKCATPVDVIEIKRDDFERYMGAVGPDAKRDLRIKWKARSLTYAKNLLRLQKNVVPRTYKKGEVVYKEGDLGTSMYRVDDDGDGGELNVSHKGRVVHKYVPGDSFGESSLLFKRPRSSTVTCASETCRLHEMKAEDFLAIVDTTPEMAAALRNMCRKRLFKKAVKAYSLEQNRGFSDEDIVAAFHDADVDGSGSLNLDEVRRLMHRMDPQYPMSDIVELLKFVDVDEDGSIKLNEFKLLFRQFDDIKEEKAKKEEMKEGN